MSDDEGGDDYGDYEDIGVGLEGDGLEEEPATREPGLPGEEEPGDLTGEEEPGLDEDAAGSDQDESDHDEEGEPTPEGETEGDDVGGLGPKAASSRQRVDPILRFSNKPRQVVVVPSDERVTDHRLHKSEVAYIIAMRAEEIAKTATVFTEAPSLHDPVAIAFKELYDRRTPFTLRRTVGTGPQGELLVEEWNVREMTLPALPPPVPLGGGSA